MGEGIFLWFLKGWGGVLGCGLGDDIDFFGDVC